MLLLSSDRWKYLHFAAGRSFTHSPLHYIYGTRVQGSPWRKIKKIWTGVKELKTTIRIWLPAIHFCATISIVLINSYQVNCYLPLKQWNQLWNVHCVKLVSTLRTESPSIFLHKLGRGRNLCRHPRQFMLSMLQIQMFRRPESNRYLFCDLSGKDRSDSASRVVSVWISSGILY